MATLATEKDVPQIYRLLHSNTYPELQKIFTPEEIEKRGFLTYAPPIENLYDMITKDDPIVMVTREEKILGYTIIWSIDYAKQLPHVQHLLQYIQEKHSSFKYQDKYILDHNWCFGGGICIDPNSRGGRTYIKLASAGQEKALKMGSDIIIGNIRLENKASLATNQSLGFEILCNDYVDTLGNKWYIVYLPLKKEVNRFAKKIIS